VAVYVAVPVTVLAAFISRLVPVENGSTSPEMGKVWGP
jgi:hypothetical protein